MDQFITPLVGGPLLGISAIWLLLSVGQVAGISGILWGSIAGPDRNWRGLFLAGLFLGGAVTHMVIGQSIPSPLRSTAMAPRHKRHACRDRNSHGRWLYQRARSLRIRPSRPRSLVATLTFMAFGVITVYLLQLINGVNL